MKNTTPLTDQSQKKTSNTLFQISVKVAEMGFDTSLDPSMALMSMRIDRIITASYSMPRILCGLPLVQALIELKREEEKRTLSLTSTPLITIYGDEDLSPLDFSILNEQVISRITTLINSMLQSAGLKTSASCLDDLALALRSRTQWQISLLPAILSSHDVVLSYQPRVTTTQECNDSQDTVGPIV